LLKKIHHLIIIAVLVERDCVVLFVANDGKIAEIIHECQGIPAKDNLNLMAGEAGGVKVVCGADAQRVGCPIAQSLAVRFFGLVEIRPARDGVAHDGFDVFRDDIADSSVRMAVKAEWEDGCFAVGQAFVATEDAEHPADAANDWDFLCWG
jgi:hypothetical protein